MSMFDYGDDNCAGIAELFTDSRSLARTVVTVAAVGVAAYALYKIFGGDNTQAVAVPNDVMSYKAASENSHPVTPTISPDLNILCWIYNSAVPEDQQVTHVSITPGSAGSIAITDCEFPHHIHEEKLVQRMIGERTIDDVMHAAIPATSDPSIGVSAFADTTAGAGVVFISNGTTALIVPHHHLVMEHSDCIAQVALVILEYNNMDVVLHTIRDVEENIKTMASMIQRGIESAQSDDDDDDVM